MIPMNDGMNEWTIHPLPNGIECKFTTFNSDRTYLVLNRAIQNYTPNTQMFGMKENKNVMKHFGI